MHVVLASTSPYRRALLARLGIAFDTVHPKVDEAIQAGETPQAMVLRLAAAKAQAGAVNARDTLVIGSDQTASLAGEPLGKPGSSDSAIAQLKAMAAREVTYFTAVALRTRTGDTHTLLDTSRVRLRPLAQSEIERYVEMEKPLDCAGALKLEGLGISLCESVETRDPTALIGLPLIATAQLLRDHGFKIP